MKASGPGRFARCGRLALTLLVSWLLLASAPLSAAVRPPMRTARIHNRANQNAGAHVRKSRTAKTHNPTVPPSTQNNNGQNANQPQNQAPQQYFDGH